MGEGPVVLHISPSWLPQTQTWLHALIAEQQRLGVSAHVVCQQTENRDQFPIRNLHSLEDAGAAYRLWDRGVRKLGLRHHLAFTVRAGKQAGATWVHSHFGDTGWHNLETARRLRVPHAITFYGRDVNMLPRDPLWRTRYLDLFRQGDLFFCEGPHMARCLQQLGCPADKIVVHHIGVRMADIPFRPRQWTPGVPLRILMACAFREKKGVPYALEMIGRLQHEVPLEVTLIGGAGPGYSLREVNWIHEIIAKHRLEGKIRMMGFQPYSVLWEEAYRHHLFLSPSVTASSGDTEGGAPVSIIEMAATGMPILSTTHCDIPEVMRPETDRFLAPEREVDALLALAQGLIRDWGALGEPLLRVRRHLEREFDLTAQARKMMACYGNAGRGTVSPA